MVPARNEEGHIAKTISEIASSKPARPVAVVVADDQSDDRTAEEALGASIPEGVVLRLIQVGERPLGWAGKVWALSCGVSEAEEFRPDYLWFVDADISVDPDVLAKLLKLSRHQHRQAVSVMARLRAVTWAEKLMMPAFVYFFGLLYPFRKVAKGTIAAGAGGCMLVEASALRRAGGLEPIRGALIDDIALAKSLRARAGARLWLGYCEGVRSRRAYGRLFDIWSMVERSAYVQLRYSPLRALLTVGAIAISFAGPVAASLGGIVLGSAAQSRSRRKRALGAAALGSLAWSTMAASYQPTIRRYGLSRPWAASLPAAGLIYGAITATAAIKHHTGLFATWKGRPVRLEAEASSNGA